ncbi:hypothetical protein JVU11DRAFT_4832 [Chiua virens]|nr:hypothetical protein JVU11DRAFT_4832 [Chiua virens]
MASDWPTREGETTHHSNSIYTGAGEHSNVCMVQASMIQGAAPMAVVAALLIVLHAWSTLQYLQCPFSFRIPRMLCLILMLGTPYLVFVIFSVGAGTLVMSQSQSVYSNGLYCIIQLGRPAVVVPSFCAAVMVIILTLEAVTTMQYYRQWKLIKASFPLATRTPSLSVCFRIGLFCLYSCVTLTSAILFLSNLRTGVTYMLPAALPLGALIVVGLQKAGYLDKMLVILNNTTQGVLSLWTTVLRGRKQSGSSFELELPSARAASGSESRSTLASIEQSEETSTEPSVPV